jgi:hypothetical protein
MDLQPSQLGRKRWRSFDSPGVCQPERYGVNDRSILANGYITQPCDIVSESELRRM